MRRGRLLLTRSTYGFGAFSPAILPSPKVQDPVPPAKAQDPEYFKDALAATTQSQRPSWNAIRRYYSEANSFPDYGYVVGGSRAFSITVDIDRTDNRPAQSDMGPERLMNQSWGSVNTLTKSGNKREFPESPRAPNQTLAKRQRLEVPLKDSFSPEPTHQTSPPSSRSTFTSRRHATRANSVRASNEKLDILVGIDDPHPGPSNVTSDIAPRPGGRKRHSANVYSPAVSKKTAKHHRAPTEFDEIETSEDELQSNHSTFSSNIRQTNFSQIKCSPRSRPRMRGDITPTKFRGNAPGEFKKHPMAILKAVSGKEMYDSLQNNHNSLSLHRSPSKPSFLEAWSDGKPDEEHQWVSFDVKDVSNLRYGGCYLSFRRSMIRGRPPTITLQFASAEGAAQVARMIDVCAAEGFTREEMKRMLDIAWKNAVQSSRHVRHDDAEAQRVPVPHGWRYDDAQIHPEAQEGGSKRLRNKMTTRPDHLDEPRRSASPVRRAGMETRRTRKVSPTRKEIPTVLERWSENNTSWEKDWNQTLVYPATGRNRASVDKEDILRLDEGEFLNDNLISFYMRYLQTKMERQQPELLSRVHIFSTFFFEKLTSRKGGINYDGVKSWTSKLDLFSYDYIVVPVNENAHWYLAVICNTPKLLEPAEHDSSPARLSTEASVLPRPESPFMTKVEREMSDISLEETTATRRSSRKLPHSRLLSSGLVSSPTKTGLATSSTATAVQGPRAPSRRTDASQARIITLDSLGSTHSPTCRALKEYLVEEARDKKHIDLVDLPGGMKARGIPEQTNFCDCGIFVLGYMEEFLKDPDDLVRRILSKDKVDWFIDAAKLRKKVRNILFKLQREQTERLAQEREAKRHKKPTSKSSISSTSGTVSKTSPRRLSTSKGAEPSTPRSPQQILPVTSPATCRSVTPPAVATRGTPGATRAITADNGIVDIVGTPQSAHTMDPSTQQSSPRPSNPQHVKLLPDSPPPSSSLDETNTNDTQDSVQLLSVARKLQTPQTCQTKTTPLYPASHS
ncbi:Peptidase C48, SUMO/Sentrin/Ubl1 [Akanthomyces lecanii RCEF 1005]|uniref:Peptidase C48, SUMO/Sentrin/Ubl1 n=1 Tax=Akanthomyces lecanii RCEF 1005 TaxID=1081108 RepID=A0A162KIU2_CORDF|nr:Peptidase C48, SUMO/Sentrin/Ubl1 [Akanthomyces lecanii RCEF 1005]